MSTDLRHRLGRAGEQAALEHLERLGFRLLAQNHRTRYGELDLVVADERTIVFAEVKSRRAGPASSPWEALTPAKQQQVRRMAVQFLMEADRPRSLELRFDAIGVLFDGQGRLVRLDHLEGAF